MFSASSRHENSPTNNESGILRHRGDMLHAQRTTNNILPCAERLIDIQKPYTIAISNNRLLSKDQRKPSQSIPPIMKPTPSHILLSLHLSTLSLTATLPPSSSLSLLTINNTLSLNTTLLSLSRYPPTPLPFPPSLSTPPLPSPQNH